MRARLPAPPSQVRQNYYPECEAALNSHAALELRASSQCRAVAFYLDRDDVGLKRFSRFFLLHSHEHSKRAESLMSLQNQRGGRVSFHNIRKPETQEWESGLKAMQDALNVEEHINQSLLDLHQLATEKRDPHLCHFLETGCLDPQVEFIKELAGHIRILSKTASAEDGLAEYLFEKLTLGDGGKKN